MPEKAYRRSIIRKHIIAARLMALRGLPAEVVDRERAIIALVWGQYRGLLKQDKIGTV